MLQGIFACFNVLSSSMSSSVAKEDSTEKPGGLASLEANVKVKKDFVFTKEEVLDWLGQALLRFASSTWTSKSTDEILYCAVDVSQAAKWTKTFDVCEKSRAMLSELFTIRALEMVEQTQDKSKLQTFARQVVALEKLNCGTVRAKTMYPTRKYEDTFEAGPDLVRVCQSFQDFTYTKDEALESLADAIVCFCASRPDSDDFLFLAVKVSQAVILVNTLDLCDTISNMLAHFKTKEALAVVQQHQGDANFNKLVERAEEEAMSKAKADRWTKHKGHPNHSRTDLFVKKQVVSQESASKEEQVAKYPRKYESNFEAGPDLARVCQSLQDFTYTKEEALESLARAIVWFGTSHPTSDDFLFLAVKVNQAVTLVNTFDLCNTSSNMLSRFETKEALALVQQHKDDANFEKLVERAESEADLKAKADRLTAHKHSHTDLFVKKQPLAKEQVLSQESSSKASKEEQVAKYPTRKYEAKRPNLVGVYQNLQDFTYTKDEALERLARAIVRFGTTWPISGGLDLLFLAVQVSQAVTLVNTFDLCDTSSNMLSRSETKEALAVVHKHKDDANFAKLVERAESEAKLKATADRLNARKGDDRHFYTEHFVEKRHLSKEQPTSSKASGVVSFDDFAFSKAEALEWLARSIVKFGLSLGIPSKQPKLEWRAVSLVEASAAVRAFEPCEKTTKVLQHKHVKDAQLLVDQIQDAAKLDGLRNAVTLEEKCIVSAFRTTCQPTNYLRLLD